MMKGICEDFGKLFKSTICWKVASGTFLAILVVEAIILVPSFQNFTRDWKNHLNNEARGAVEALVITQPADTFSMESFSSGLDALVGAGIIKGWSVSHNDDFLSGGQPPERVSKGSSVEHSDSLNPDGDLDIYWEDQAQWDPYQLRLRLSLEGLGRDQLGYLYRIGGLIGIISLFVTAATMLVLNYQVLRPVLDLYSHVLSANKDKDYYQSRIVNRSARNELGKVIHAFNEMLEHIDRSLYEAQFDDLTRLPNRAVGLEFLQRSIDQASRDKRLVAVMFIDLDHFKEVNDTLGHSSGDLLLIEASERLSDSIRSGDSISLKRATESDNTELVLNNMVSRFGGDEFMVVLPEIHSEEDAAIVAQRISRAFQQPFSVDQQQRYFSSSIGIALYPRDGETPKQLLMSADTALYATKDAGRDHYRFFSNEMNRKLLERLEIEAELRRGLDAGELKVYYQPVVDVVTKHVVGVEALVRWQHPEWGWVSPETFISVAETSGIIIPLGEWILMQACSDAQCLHNTGYPLNMAINISYQQFRQGNLVDTINRVIEKTGFRHECLDLEITEGLFIDEHLETQLIIDQLSRQGVGFAIDDFGTGYSALGYLQRFKLDTLKIDRSFISGIESDKQSAALSRTIIAMAKNLGLKTVAEGVESETQHTFLQELHCEYAQGYFYGKPMPMEELLIMLESQADSFLPKSRQA